MEQTKPAGDKEIIPIPGGGNTSRGVIGIIGAISHIQQFYVIESLGQDIPEDFLTLEGQLSYFNCGFSSGFLEGLMFAVMAALFVPLLADSSVKKAVADYFPLIQHTWFIWAVNCLPIFIFCSICCYLSKYRVGTLTKKAVDNLLVGRLFAMALKGSLIFVVFMMLANYIENPEHAAKTARILCTFNKENLVKTYLFLLELPDTLRTTAYDVALIFSIATIIPFGTIWFVSVFRNINRKRVEQFWNI
jgi:hypothetical protein